MILNELDVETERKIMKHQKINFTQLGKKYCVNRHTISRHYEAIKSLHQKKNDVNLQ